MKSLCGVRQERVKENPLCRYIRGLTRTWCAGPANFTGKPKAVEIGPHPCSRRGSNTYAATATTVRTTNLIHDIRDVPGSLGELEPIHSSEHPAVG